MKTIKQFLGRQLTSQEIDFAKEKKTIITTNSKNQPKHIKVYHLNNLDQITTMENFNIIKKINGSNKIYIIKKIIKEFDDIGRIKSKSINKYPLGYGNGPIRENSNIKTIKYNPSGKLFGRKR